jgi:transmembrane sensor
MRQNDFKNLVPPLTESRLARQYDAVRARVPARPGRRSWWGASAGVGGWAVAAACAVALVFMWLRLGGTRGSTIVDGTIVESAPAGDGARTSITLADGSRVDLGLSSRARLTSTKPKAIRIDLERGSIEVEATHVEGRTFEVAAGGYEVHVVGTHFAVQREPGERITVRVDRGAVDVVASAGGEARRLAAGEQWSAPDGEAALAPSQVPAVPAASTPIGTTAAVPPEGSGTIDAPAARPSVGATGGGATHHDETARELFDEAQRARADGRADDAARAFDRLRRTYPHDARAALSALELGRLRLDRLDDPRGAEEALHDAIALGPRSPFREDAEARRVEALGRMGDAAGCASARAAYLARWPNGTYRRAVEVGCGDR